MSFTRVISTLILMALTTASGLAVAAENLVIYSGRSDSLVKPVMAAFSKKTGIEVQLYNASSTALLNKLKVEGGRTQADLFLSNDAGNLQLGSDLGLFQALPPKSIAVIDEHWRAADNTWVGLSGRARVIIVNNKAADAKNIQSILDLAQPQYKNRIGTVNASNESFIAGTSVYLKMLGKDKTQAWLEGLKTNADKQVYAKHEPIVENVMTGKLDIGLVNHYYAYRYLEKHPDAPYTVIFPDQGKNDIGAAMNISGIAISKYSKKALAAQQLVDFLVSEEGQKIFAEVNHEFPTRLGVATAKNVPPLKNIKVATVPMSELAKLRKPSIDLLEAVGMP